MKEEAKLGRFVQCRCSHTCASQGFGFQWLLPKTKSKHMLFEEILIKNDQDQVDMMKQLEEAFSSISLDKVNNKKIKKRFNSSIVNLKKKLIKEKKDNNLIVLKEFTVICSNVPTTTLFEQFTTSEYY